MIPGTFCARYKEIPIWFAMSCELCSDCTMLLVSACSGGPKDDNILTVMAHAFAKGYHSKEKAIVKFAYELRKKLSSKEIDQLLQDDYDSRTMGGRFQYCLMPSLDENASPSFGKYLRFVGLRRDHWYVQHVVYSWLFLYGVAGALSHYSDQRAEHIVRVIAKLDYPFCKYLNTLFIFNEDGDGIEDMTKHMKLFRWYVDSGKATKKQLLGINPKSVEHLAYLSSYAGRSEKIWFVSKFLPLLGVTRRKARLSDCYEYSNADRKYAEKLKAIFVEGFGDGLSDE